MAQSCRQTRYGFRDLFVGQCVDIAQPESAKMLATLRLSAEMRIRGR